MNKQIQDIIKTFDTDNISSERKEILQPFAEYLKRKYPAENRIAINFICTHNSRRSLLAQVWSQTIANYFKLQNIVCYSGGTETTHIAVPIIQTLMKQGFEVIILSKGENPIYAIKYDDEALPIIGYSKPYDSRYNATSNFVAVLTCQSAYESCVHVLGALERFAITYNDPKIYDNTSMQVAKYNERSMQIAEEMWWVFSQIKLK